MALLAQQSFLETQLQGRLKIILKCVECGNTFQKERVQDGEIVTCPICEANYTAVVKDGKTSLIDYVFEEKDLGEL